MNGLIDTLHPRWDLKLTFEDTFKRGDILQREMATIIGIVQTRSEKDSTLTNKQGHDRMDCLMMM